jgi:hypothetical protein
MFPHLWSALFRREIEKYGVKCMFLHLWSALFRREIEKYGVKCMFQKRSAFGLVFIFITKNN